jgi:hypothetical protein
MPENSSSDDDDTPDDYDVGYGRPPKETRFKPGKSGNPRGRPKKKRHFRAALRDALEGRVEVVNEAGVKRRIPAIDVIMNGLVKDAARRKPAAMRQIFQLIRIFLDDGSTREDPVQQEAERQEAKERLLEKLSLMAERMQAQRNEPSAES